MSPFDVTRIIELQHKLLIIWEICKRKVIPATVKGSDGREL